MACEREMIVPDWISFRHQVALECVGLDCAGICWIVYWIVLWFRLPKQRVVELVVGNVREEGGGRKSDCTLLPIVSILAREQRSERMYQAPSICCLCNCGSGMAAGGGGTAVKGLANN